MDGNAKRRIGICALSVSVTVGAIGIASLNASGEELNPAGPYPAFAPYGTLALEVGPQPGDFEGMLTLTLVDGTVLTQAIETTNPCAKIALEPIKIQGNPADDPYPGENLLDFESLIGNPLAAGGSVQIPGSVLGVESGTNCGVPTGQLGPSEALRMSLGSFGDFDAKSVSVQSGTLAIGKTDNKDKQLRVAYDTGAFGTDIAIAEPGTNVTSGAFADSITLRSTATLSSRGLSVKSGTVFNLVVPTIGDFENAVPCDQTVTDFGASGEIATSATFYRAFDNKGTARCTDEVGVTVDITNSVVSWDNATIGVNGIVQNVAGLMTIDWAPIDASQAPEVVQTALAREIDYDAAGTAAEFVPVQWCTSFAEVLPVTTPREFEVDMPANVFDVDAGDVPWCLVSDTQQLVAGNIVQTQVYYGEGDPWNR